jgi:transcriptional regulator with XRE-family HTH domain
MSPITDRVKFANRLCREMQRARIDSRHLAAVTRIPVMVIERWRDGQATPTPLAIGMLATALGVPVSRLIDQP